jgi:YHS domain-containing protein
MDAVCGMIIDKEGAMTAVHENRRLYFCSEQCRNSYTADPEKYALDYEVVAGEVKRSHEMKYKTVFEGRPYRFISEANKKKFDEDPDAYVYAECPVGGEVFLRKNAAGKREYKGKTYYLGCKGCLALFDKDPAVALNAGTSACPKSCPHASAEKAGMKGEKSLTCPHAKKTDGCPHAKKLNEAGHKECPHAKAQKTSREKKEDKQN